MSTPINLRVLSNRSRTVTVTLPDELGTITIVYRPPTAESTASLADRMAEPNIIARPIDKLARDLADIIESWDVTGDDGNPIRPSYEVLRAIDITILNPISAAIIEHIYPPKRPAGG